MSQFYKILKADKLGESYTPSFEGAKPIQTWWCQVEGLDKDVSIGKQVGNELTPGQHIYGDLMYAKSQKGTEYWKFKSAKVPDDVQRPADTPAQATAQQAVGGTPVNMSAQQPDWFQPWANLLTEVNNRLKALMGEEDTIELKQKPIEVPDLEAVDEETQKVVDELFPEQPTEEAK